MLKQQIENIIKKQIEESIENDRLISISLIADEVLKVVVEKLSSINLHIICGGNGMCECGTEKGTCGEQILQLLSNLSPNKENKNNEEFRS